MVYESDFYTTRRPYRPTSYSSVTRRPGDWEKVPFVPRPSLVPDPVTAFGRRTRPGERPRILEPVTRQNIQPMAEYKLAPLAPYVSPRDQTRERVLATPLSSLYYLSSLLPYYHVPYITYIPSLSQAELIYRPTTRTVTRLVTYPEVPHHIVRVRVRPSVVLRELDRIAYRRRPALAVSAVDDFFRAETTKAFEDESRRIRADTASLLQRARSVLPRAKSMAPRETIYSYSYGEPIPYRFSNDAYIARLLLPLRSVYDNIHNISYYSEPAKKFTGRGHLACVHYSGKKAFSNRLPLYKEMSIRDDVNLLSFYAKNRLAAAGLAVQQATAGGAPEQPTAAQCA